MALLSLQKDTSNGRYYLAQATGFNAQPSYYEINPASAQYLIQNGLATSYDVQDAGYAKANATPITLSGLSSLMQTYYNSIPYNYGGAVPAGETKPSNVNQGVWDDLVRRSQENQAQYAQYANLQDIAETAPTATTTAIPTFRQRYPNEDLTSYLQAKQASEQSQIGTSTITMPKPDTTVYPGQTQPGVVQTQAVEAAEPVTTATQIPTAYQQYFNEWKAKGLTPEQISQQYAAQPTSTTTPQSLQAALDAIKNTVATEGITDSKTGAVLQAPTVNTQGYQSLANQLGSSTSGTTTSAGNQTGSDLVNQYKTDMTNIQNAQNTAYNTAQTGLQNANANLTSAYNQYPTDVNAALAKYTQQIQGATAPLQTAYQNAQTQTQQSYQPLIQGYQQYPQNVQGLLNQYAQQTQGANQTLQQAYDQYGNKLQESYQPLQEMYAQAPAELQGAYEQYKTENAASTQELADAYANAPAQIQQAYAPYMEAMQNYPTLAQQAYDPVNQAYTSISEAIRNRPSMVDEYNKLMTEAGVPAEKTNLANLSAKAAQLEEQIENLPTDVRDRVKNFLMTQSQYQRITSAEAEPLTKLYNSLSRLKEATNLSVEQKTKEVQNTLNLWQQDISRTEEALQWGLQGAKSLSDLKMSLLDKGLEFAQLPAELGMKALEYSLKGKELTASMKEKLAEMGLSIAKEGIDMKLKAAEIPAQLGEKMAAAQLEMAGITADTTKKLAETGLQTSIEALGVQLKALELPVQMTEKMIALKLEGEKLTASIEEKLADTGLSTALETLGKKLELAGIQTDQAAKLIELNLNKALTSAQTAQQAATTALQTGLQQQELAQSQYQWEKEFATNDAYKQALTEQAKANAIAAAKGGGGLTDYQTTTVFNNIANKYQSSPSVLASQKMAGYYSTIQAATTNPSPQKDLALIYSFIKALDYGDSAVREGEIQLAMNTAGVRQEIEGKIAQLQGGGLLASDTRENYVAAATGLMDAINNVAQQKQAAYTAQAQAAGIGGVWNNYLNSLKEITTNPVNVNTGPTSPTNLSTGQSSNQGQTGSLNLGISNWLQSRGL